MALDTNIVALKHVDVIRDGGSLAASFIGANEIEYCLFFRIRGPLVPDAPRRYGAPALQWFCPYVYRSPVTGDTAPMWREDSEPIDWEEARRIIRELAPFVAQSEPEFVRIFDYMRQAAANDGG